MFLTRLFGDDRAKGMDKISGEGDDVTAMVQSANERLHLGVVGVTFCEDGGD